MIKDRAAHSGRRRALVIVAWIVSLLVVAGISWWAGTVTLAPPTVDNTSDPTLTVAVGEGTLGRSITIPVTAAWDLAPLAVAAGDGVVTSVDIADGTLVNVGDRLLTLDLKPVIVAQGAVPAFRDIMRELEGADVLQLQQFLAAAGFYDGPHDGEFGGGTDAAVKAWQKSLGLPETGMVTSSDLVFVPTLPARVALADEIRVGSRLSPGEELLQLVSPEPVFKASLNDTQMTTVSTGAMVTVIAGESRWDAIMGETTHDPNGIILADLVSPTGGAVCGEECIATVPVNTDGTYASFSAELVVTPATSGAMAPSSAVVTEPSGQAVVVLVDGTRQPVEVLITQDGQSIITGVDVGTTILAAPGQ